MKKVIITSKVTDFMSSDDLHELMKSCKQFGEFSHYQQMEGNIVKTTKSNITFPGADSSARHRYWKFVKNADNEWEVYEIDTNGKQIGKPFKLS